MEQDRKTKFHFGNLIIVCSSQAFQQTVYKILASGYGGCTFFIISNTQPRQMSTAKHRKHLLRKDCFPLSYYLIHEVLNVELDGGRGSNLSI